MTGLILMVGGAYTYALVQLSFRIQDWFGLVRNNYDKVGHFAQGFTPALVAREFLIRLFKLSPMRLVACLCVCICFAVSAAYELVEWCAALCLGADEFLGTQGDPRDTQSDMFFARIGAIVALLTLSHWHTRRITDRDSRPRNPPTSA